jgi:hypothetical protein
MVYRRIPSGEFESANIAQIIDSFMEVRLALYAFESWFKQLELNSGIS